MARLERSLARTEKERAKLADEVAAATKKGLLASKSEEASEAFVPFLFKKEGSAGRGRPCHAAGRSGVASRRAP